MFKSSNNFKQRSGYIKAYCGVKSFQWLCMTLGNTIAVIVSEKVSIFLVRATIYEGVFWQKLMHLDIMETYYVQMIQKG